MTGNTRFHGGTHARSSASSSGRRGRPGRRPQATRAQAKPRVTFISQWSSGSDGNAISGLGKRLEEEGGIWQHSPVPGFTTEMMNKLRADIIAGNPPAASQLKGPEISCGARSRRRSTSTRWSPPRATRS
jgi:hypothetical protein